MGIERLAVRISHLNLVDATEIDPAVAALGQAGFERQVEVLEFPVGAQVAVVLARFAFLLLRVISAGRSTGNNSVRIELGAGQAT